MVSDLLLMLPVVVLAVALFLLRVRRKQKYAPEGPPPNAIAVDGSNVMHWGGEPSAKVLRKVLSALIEGGYEPILFFDANVGYVLDNRYYAPRELARLTGLPEQHICVVNKGTIADEVILAFSGHHGLRVVSNDQYRDWRVKFPHLAKKGSMLRGSFNNGAVVWRGKL